MHHGAGTIKLWITFCLGLLFTVLGIFSTLFSLGVELDAVSAIPGFLYSAMVTKIALIIAGLILLYASFSMRDLLSYRIKTTSVIAGIVLAFIGALPLLIDYGLLNDSLPFIVNLSIPNLILSLLLAFYGVYLIISFFKLFGVYKSVGSL